MNIKIYLIYLLKNKELSHKEFIMYKKIIIVALFDFESFGVRSLASALDMADIQYNILYFQNFDFNNLKLPTEENISTLIDWIAQQKPDIIGFSFRSPTFQIAKQLTTLLKQKFEIPVIWGGAHATIKWKECSEIADYVFLGESENSLPKFLKTGNLSNGVVSNKKISKVKIQWIEKMDSINPPLYENINSYYQIDNQIHSGDPVLFVDTYDKYGETELYETMASRGCPFSCSYCSAPTISTRKIRYRSVVNVINEIKEFRKIKDIKRINFLDDVFGWNKEWLREFANQYRKEINLPFTAEIHPMICTEERISLFKHAGMVGVEIGVQSGSERTRKQVYNRHIDQKDILEGVERLVNNNIAVTIDLIIDNPYENEDDLKESFLLLLDLPRNIGIKVFSLSNLPGTELTEKLVKDGLIELSDVEDIACKTHKMWRARITHTREEWRQYWSLLIILASIRNLTASQSWLATPTNLDANYQQINKYSKNDLLQLLNDRSYREDLNKLQNLVNENLPVNQKNQIG